MTIRFRKAASQRQSDNRPLWYRQLLDQYERELQIVFVLWVSQLKAEIASLPEIPVAGNDAWWMRMQRTLEARLRPKLYQFAVEGSRRQTFDLGVPIGQVEIGNRMDTWATRHALEESRLIVDETVKAADWAAGRAEQLGLSQDRTQQLVGGQLLGLNRQQVAGMMDRLSRGIEIDDDVGRLTMDRAELVAANNAVDSLNEGMFASVLFLDSSGFTITKTWITAADERVCRICFPLHGQEVPLRQDFRTGGRYFEKPKAHPKCRCGVEYKIHGDPTGALIA